jgi:serine/threonine-protein phosphatase PPG1
MAPFDLDACIERLKNKQLLGEALLREICEKTKEVLMRESNVVHVQSPVTVVGDIHGQFHDLIEIFRIGGWAPDTNYLFLGECYSDAILMLGGHRTKSQKWELLAFEAVRC